MNSNLGQLPQQDEKVWFIILDHGHEGPYVYKDLIDMAAKGKINADSAVWTYRWVQPRPWAEIQFAYGDVAAEMAPVIEEKIKQEVELPPELPPIPQKPAEKNDREPTVEVVPEFIAPQLEEIPEIPNKTAAFRPFLWGWGLLGFVFVCMAIAWWRLPKINQAERPQNMTRSEYERLVTQEAKTAKGQPVRAVSVSADYATIWLLETLPHNCAYHVKFTALKDRVLTQENIVFEAQTLSTKRWIVLDRLNFILGRKLISGEYLVEVRRSACQPPWWAKWFGGVVPDANFHFKALLSAYPESEFNTLLDKWLEKVRQEKLQKNRQVAQLWSDVRERYRLLEALGHQAEQIFNVLTDRKMQWGKRIETVTKNYTAQVGAGLTHFLNKNDEYFTQLALQEIEEKSPLLNEQEQIVRHAKSIGRISMLFLEQVQQNREPPPKRTELLSWLEKLKRELATERAQLSGKIDSISAHITSLESQ